MDNDLKNHSDIDEKPLIGPVKKEGVKDELQKTDSNDSTTYVSQYVEKVKDELQDADDNISYYDLEYDEEVNRLLDEVKEEFLLYENSETLTEKQDFLEDNNQAEPKIPDGYQELLHSKIRETNKRLKKLSKRVCDACPTARNHIQRIEQDHSTHFCKMDYPRHPPWDKPWKNCWKFKTIIRCKDIDKPKHVHTIKCDGMILLENNVTKVTTETPNLSQVEYPKHVMDAVQFFQDFAKEIDEKFSISFCMRAFNTVCEKHMWISIKFVVTSNYRNETAIVIRGDKISPMISHFEAFFHANRQRIPNVVIVICHDTSWSKQKITERLPAMPVIITGHLLLKDKVGPIFVQHCLLKNFSPGFMSFNPVEIIQLSEIIQDYTGLTEETTLLNIGCKNVLSLTIAHECKKIIALKTRDFSYEENVKELNKIFNVLFIKCEPQDALSTCSPLINGSVAVAVLNLSSRYSKSNHVMKALRDIPSIWRVVIYGRFFEEFHENISVLTREDNSMGERYLPMQGCILDKSPSIKEAFDIVIVFERKSLVQPKIELLAPGPTLNVKVNSRPSSNSTINDKSLADNNQVEDMDISPISQNSDIIETPNLSNRITRFSPILENVNTAEGFEFSITANATFFGLKVNAKSKDNGTEKRVRFKPVEELIQVEDLDKQIEEDIAIIAKNRELIRKYFQAREEERMNNNKQLKKSKSPPSKEHQ